MFKPIKHRRVYTEIVAQIKELINEGKRAVGPPGRGKGEVVEDDRG